MRRSGGSCLNSSMGSQLPGTVASTSTTGIALSDGSELTRLGRSRSRKPGVDLSAMLGRCAGFLIFLESWGLINYTPSARPLPKEKKDSGEMVEMDTPKRMCNNCKSLCGTSFFNAEKAVITLCSRCFVRGIFRAGLNALDFKRVDVCEETKTEWTDKETLHLLEAILYHGEDWKVVADHVGSRSEKECVARFIKLPFGEHFLGPSEYEENDEVHSGTINNDIVETSLSKRKCLTPLADASNPIMAQVAFLAAMVGPAVAETATDTALQPLMMLIPPPSAMPLLKGMDLATKNLGKKKTIRLFMNHTKRLLLKHNHS